MKAFRVCLITLRPIIPGERLLGRIEQAVRCSLDLPGGIPIETSGYGAANPWISRMERAKAQEAVLSGFEHFGAIVLDVFSYASDDIVKEFLAFSWKLVVLCTQAQTIASFDGARMAPVLLALKLPEGCTHFGSQNALCLQRHKQALLAE